MYNYYTILYCGVLLIKKYSRILSVCADTGDMEFLFSEESTGIEAQQPVGDKVEELLKTVLANQAKILENQKIVMDQFFHFGKRLNNLENIFNENKIEASEHRSVCKMIGEEVDEIQTEISLTLPLQTVAAAKEFETKLLQQQYLEAMKSFLLKIKGPETTVDDLLRQIYSDEMLWLCNWDGRGNKEALSQYSIVSDILYDMFQLCAQTYEKNIRKSIELSHHRLKQRDYRQRHKNKK
ncbi:uncharacterized protein LOC128863479 isoform X2 [Anastrepha ludens]|uniref:uncharacterized protein LOC128863479 isoform X2 n=2 Tax=Anastrepha ludens TaxID=28586 RepID=UPI0023B07577|nr:uncharacterized protein LOC128863479 isoform X2 [Anastrepha ludens]